MSGTLARQPDHKPRRRFDVRVLGTILGAALVMGFAACAVQAFVEISVAPNLKTPWLLVVPLILARKHARKFGPLLILVVRNVITDIRRPPTAQPATFRCRECGTAYLSPYYFRRGSETCTECDRRRGREALHPGALEVE